MNGLRDNIEGRCATGELIWKCHGSSFNFLLRVIVGRNAARFLALCAFGLLATRPGRSAFYTLVIGMDKTLLSLGFPAGALINTHKTTSRIHIDNAGHGY